MNWFTFWGIALLVLSTLIGFGGLMMDSAVPTTEGTIHNLSRAHSQLIVLGIAAVGWLSGIMLVGFGSLAAHLERAASAEEEKRAAQPRSQPVVPPMPRSAPSRVESR